MNHQVTCNVIAVKTCCFSEMWQAAEAWGPGGALRPAAQTGAERTAGGGAVTVLEPKVLIVY